MRPATLIVLFATGALGSAAVHAHHAFATEFDVDRPVEFEGTVTKVELINPHSWIHVEVVDENGETAVWMIEGGSPNQLIRLGVTKNTLAIGTELVVDGYQAKDGTNKGVGRDFTLADGKRLFLGGSAAEIETGR